MLLVVADGCLPVLLNHFHAVSKAILIVSSVSDRFAKEIPLLLVGLLLRKIHGRFGHFVATTKQIPKALSALKEHGDLLLGVRQSFLFWIVIKLLRVMIGFNTRRFKIVVFLDVSLAVDFEIRWSG